MSSAQDPVDWTTASQCAGFGDIADADEFFHGFGPAGDSLTETWFWGFAVPEQAINCYLYSWVHPNLDVVSMGLTIYRGITPHHLAAELFDFPTYLRASDVVGDGSNIVVPNGLTVTVVEPLRHIRISYADEPRDTAIEVELRADLDHPLLVAEQGEQLGDDRRLGPRRCGKLGGLGRAEPARLDRLG